MSAEIKEIVRPRGLSSTGRDTSKLSTTDVYGLGEMRKELDDMLQNLGDITRERNKKNGR